MTKIVKPARRREAFLGRVVTQLQALRRGAVQARQFRRKRASAIVLQAAWHCATARRAFLCSRAATICIQAAWRGLMARRAYQAARVGSAPSPQHVMKAGHVHDILRRVIGRRQPCGEV